MIGLQKKVYPQNAAAVRPSATKEVYLKMQQQHGVLGWGVYPNAAAARSWAKGVYPPGALQQQQQQKRDFIFCMFLHFSAQSINLPENLQEASGRIQKANTCAKSRQRRSNDGTRAVSPLRAETAEVRFSDCSNCTTYWTVLDGRSSETRPASSIVF